MQINDCEQLLPKIDMQYWHALQYFFFSKKYILSPVSLKRTQYWDIFCWEVCMETEAFYTWDKVILSFSFSHHIINLDHVLYKVVNHRTYLINNNNCSYAKFGVLEYVCGWSKIISILLKIIIILTQILF